MKKLILGLTVAAGLYSAAAMTTQCPFVDARTGLQCAGFAYPSTITAGGTLYRCSNGHRWIEAN